VVDLLGDDFGNGLKLHGSTLDFASFEGRRVSAPATMKSISPMFSKENF
jgi:hypothetical protein